MKKYKACSLLIIMNLLISVNLFSQPYKSIYGKDSTEWNIFCEEFTYFGTSIYNICCDTIINTKNYKKIVLINHTNCLFQNKCLFISEDTLDGKLWLYDSEEGKEYLSMNLNLNIGDTFRLNPDAFYSADSIAIVDSVYYENAIKKIRINYKNILPANEEKLTFIEGIGPNFGVFFQASIYFGYNPPRQLLCVSKDGIYVYKNKINSSGSWTDTCNYFVVGIIEKNKKIKIEISPNPMQEELNFTFSETFEGNITIYNVLGGVEEKKYLKNILNYKMELGTLKKGIYFIQITNNNLLITKKIIKY